MAIMIRDWYITADTHESLQYVAPECRPTCLSGKVDWHPELVITPTMCDVITSPIKSVNGRLVTTSSGRQYQLIGQPSQYFYEFLKSKGLEFDDNNPLHEVNVKGYLHG